MKVPSIFLPETQRKELEKEIEEIINNTLIDKVLIEKIGEELKEYLESKTLAEAFKILFKKTIDLSKDGSIKTVTKRSVADSYRDNYDIEKLPYFCKPQKVVDSIKAEKESSIRKKETTSLLEEIRELEPCLKEDSIMDDYENSFSIVTKEFIYDMVLNINNRECKCVETGETTTVGRYHKRTVPIIKAYYHPIMEGSITYAKFNQEHHEKIIKALKKRNYLTTIEIKKQ